MPPPQLSCIILHVALNQSQASTGSYQPASAHAGRRAICPHSTFTSNHKIRLRLRAGPFVLIQFLHPITKFNSGCEPGCDKTLLDTNLQLIDSASVITRKQISQLTTSAQPEFNSDPQCILTLLCAQFKSISLPFVLLFPAIIIKYIHMVQFP